jgi:hypothetical protein
MGYLYAVLTPILARVAEREGNDESEAHEEMSEPLFDPGLTESRQPR